MTNGATVNDPLTLWLHSLHSPALAGTHLRPAVELLMDVVDVHNHLLTL